MREHVDEADLIARMSLELERLQARPVINVPCETGIETDPTTVFTVVGALQLALRQRAL